MSHILQQMSVAPQGSGFGGIYSVCSAHPLVLRASMQQAKQDGTPLLIEATSNQVNQFGGYTGMRPADFREFVFTLADQEGFPREHLILGGDHLGPNPWQNLPAEEAMQHAEAMVEEYSREGFTKIHLDASMSCVGDPHPLSDATVAERAARLCHASERSAKGAPRFYIIGTEVPVPGGATESLAGLQVTSYEHASKTLAIHREIFQQAGLEGVWQRVIGLVVQPGVEFNHDSVVEYVSSKTVELRKVLPAQGGLVFEAHSTDYQRPEAFVELVRDGFAILKVGPALTFALREALFALEKVEQELIEEKQRSNLASVIETTMVEQPKNWASHYHGTPDQQRILRRYSYSDRLRYYWNVPAVHAAFERLMKNLESITIPETLLSAVLPEQYTALRNHQIAATPEQIVIHKIRQAIQPYANAGICRITAY